jgi:hypothetical protein
MRSAAPSTRHLALALIGLIGLTPACKGKSSRPPEAGAGAATAMGNWAQWRDLSPLLDVARTHAPKPTITAIERARDHLRAGKPLAAERALAQLADSEGRDWIAAARGDLAALYFSTCIRGVAWRIPESVEAVQGRTIDFTEGAKVAPTDLAIEPLLVALDQAVEAKVPALALHARIARARVTAYVSRCAPNEQVARLAQGMVKGDLAQLAAEGHLTPDLAYLWGGIQLTEYSASAARPFLLQAREAGFDDPALLYLLAVVALEQRDLRPAPTPTPDRGARRVRQEPERPRTKQAQAAVPPAARSPAPAPTPSRRPPRTTRRPSPACPAHPAAMLGLARLVLAAEG